MCDWSLSPPSGLPSPVVTVRSHWLSSTLLLSTKVRPATSLPSCQLYLASVNQGQVCYQSTILSALPCFCQPRSGLLPVYHPVSSTLLLSTKVRSATSLPSCQLCLASVNQGQVCYQSTILSALPCFCQPRSGLLPVYHPVSSTLLLSTKVRSATSLPSCQLYLASVNQGPACYQSTILSALPCFCQPRSGLLPVYHPVSSTLLLSTKVRPATSLPSCQLCLASVNQGPACYQSTILSALPCFCQPRSGLLPVYHPVSSTLLLSTKVRPATSLPSCQLCLASVNQGPACYQSTILSALPCFCQPRSGLLPVYHPVVSTLLLSTKVRPATSLPSCRLCLASVNQGPACYQSTILSSLPCFCQPRSGLLPVYHPVSSTLLLSTKVRPATSLPSCQLYLASVNQGQVCYQSTILSALPCFCQPRSGLLPVYHPVSSTLLLSTKVRSATSLPSCQLCLASVNQGQVCYQSTILSALPCFCQPRSGLLPVYHPVSSTLLLSTKVRPGTSLPSCRLYLASVNQGPAWYQSTILSALPCFCQPRSGLLPVYHPVVSTLLLSTKVRPATSLPSCQLYLASVNQGQACYQSTIPSALPCFCQPRSGLLPVYHPVRARSMVVPVFYTRCPAPSGSRSTPPSLMPVPLWLSVRIDSTKSCA